MRMIEATYYLSTPLFCGGADQEPELRLPSFKGVLRYWWRALAWFQYDGDLQKIQKKENYLFGSAAAGQSRVLLRLLPQEKEPQIIHKGKLTRSRQSQDPAVERAVKRGPTPRSREFQDPGEGARYLGYGVMNAEELTRACLMAPWEFTVQLRVRPLDEDESDLKLLVEDALVALGTIGGMGSKSRKGYGSLVLQSLRIDSTERWREPKSMEALDNAIRERFSRYRKQPALPEFTAFSSRARHVLLSSQETKQPLELLNLVGKELVRYRSWGRDGQLSSREPSEKNFKDDHDLMKKLSKERTKHPRRIAFGLPHNYGSKKNQQVGPEDSSMNRRASPLFIHIHQCGGKPVAVLSFLPARFLPPQRGQGPFISVGGTKVCQQPEEELYKPINHFLDRLLDSEKRKESFTQAVEVQP